jgi:hypothetical protein
MVRNSRLQRVILGVTFSIVPFLLATPWGAQSLNFIRQSSGLLHYEVSSRQNFCQLRIGKLDLQQSMCEVENNTCQPEPI